MIRGLDEELRTRKYAHVERERRFLVDPARRPDLVEMPHVLIEDRYITGTLLRLRRMTASDSGRTVLKHTKNYGGTYLSDAEYDLLAGLPAHPLKKRRCAVDDFSIDLFEGRLSGLELAESEQSDDAALAALTPPLWSIREVSDVRAYAGGALALADRPPVD